MNEETFNYWIDKIWKPFLSRFPRTLLILDRFKVHSLDQVKARLANCNTDILYIPKGLTFAYQSCDVYLNKPLKDRIRIFWQKYMSEQNNSGIFLFLKFILIERPLKPQKEVLISCIDESFKSCQFEDDVFFSVILKDFDIVIQKEEELDSEFGDDQELICESGESEGENDETDALQLI